MDPTALCGSLVIGGFSGLSLPAEYGEALRRGRRGGAILFRRNLDGDPRQAAMLAREVHAALPSPILAIDQEGGRVARLGPPFLNVPPMRAFGAWDDVGLAERVASAVGAELAAIGITVVFAPVLDVDTNPENPVIGDRAFASDPGTCARFGEAWTRGLQSAGVLATGKHFPGHGDTSKDSHLDLPRVEQTRERLHAVELVPFRAAAAAGLAAMMTAHVVFDALDPARPGTAATLSAAICTELLRDQIGFEGLLLSDDLEMHAIGGQSPISEAAVGAVAAGCDALLVCHSFEAQEAALEALIRESAQSSAFRDRCRGASVRVVAARRRALARPLDDDAVARLLASRASRALEAELAPLRSGVPGGAATTAR